MNLVDGPRGLVLERVLGHIHITWVSWASVHLRPASPHQGWRKIAVRHGVPFWRMGKSDSWMVFLRDKRFPYEQLLVTNTAMVSQCWQSPIQICDNGWPMTHDHQRNNKGVWETSSRCSKNMPRSDKTTTTQYGILGWPHCVAVTTMSRLVNYTCSTSQIYTLMCSNPWIIYDPPFATEAPRWFLHTSSIIQPCHGYESQCRVQSTCWSCQRCA